MTMVSAEWLARYYERTVGRPWGYWDPTLDSVLADRIRRLLLLGLERLNTLPATDPFWSSTNREPTLYKLNDYFGPRLSSHPDDEDSRWIMASLLLYNGRDNELGLVLEPLLNRGFENIEWIMAAGSWCRKGWGFSHTSSMRDLLIKIRGRLPELRDRLESLRPNATPHRLAMIEEVLKLSSPDWEAALRPPSTGNPS